MTSALECWHRYWDSRPSTLHPSLDGHHSLRQQIQAASNMEAVCYATSHCPFLRNVAGTSGDKFAAHLAVAPEQSYTGAGPAGQPGCPLAGLKATFRIFHDPEAGVVPLQPQRVVDVEGRIFKDSCPIGRASRQAQQQARSFDPDTQQSQEPACPFASISLRLVRSCQTWQLLSSGWRQHADACERLQQHVRDCEAVELLLGMTMLDSCIFSTILSASASIQRVPAVAQFPLAALFHLLERLKLTTMSSALHSCIDRT